MANNETRPDILFIGNDEITHVNIYPDQMAEYAKQPCVGVQTSDMTCYLIVKADADADEDDPRWKVDVYDEYPILNTDEFQLSPITTRYCTASEIYAVRQENDVPVINWVALPKLRTDRTAWALLCCSPNRCKNEKQLSNAIQHMRETYERNHNRAPNLPVDAYKVKKLNLSDWFTIAYSVDETGELNGNTYYRWFIREVPSVEEVRKFLERMRERTTNEEIHRRIDYVLKTI